MTLYADLHLSLIDELPPGRQAIKTYAVDYSYETRIYRFIDQEIAKDRQAFIVCPLIEENEKLDLASATQLFAQLSKKVFPKRNVLPPPRKDESSGKRPNYGRLPRGEKRYPGGDYGH